MSWLKALIVYWAVKGTLHPKKGKFSRHLLTSLLTESQVKWQRPLLNWSSWKLVLKSHIKHKKSPEASRYKVELKRCYLHSRCVVELVHPLQTLAATVKISSNRRNSVTSYQLSLGFRGFWRLELGFMMLFSFIFQLFCPEIFCRLQNFNQLVTEFSFLC